MTIEKSARELALEYIELEEQMIQSMKDVDEFDEKIRKIDVEINELIIKKEGMI